MIFGDVGLYRHLVFEKVRIVESLKMVSMQRWNPGSGETHFMSPVVGIEEVIGAPTTDVEAIEWIAGQRFEDVIVIATRTSFMGISPWLQDICHGLSILMRDVHAPTIREQHGVRILKRSHFSICPRLFLVFFDSINVLDMAHGHAGIEVRYSNVDVVVL